MKTSLLVIPLLLSIALLPCTGRADDKKKKMLEWQMQHQNLVQQWKLQEVQRQQQLLQKQKAQQRNRAVVVAGAPWGVNESGRGTIRFSDSPPDRLNSAVVTLNNFFNSRGDTNNSGSATVTLYGDYSYPMRGTWTMLGDFTVGLTLTPSANNVSGDRISGMLNMQPPNGDRLSKITLSGRMSGYSFNASFSR